MKILSQDTTLEAQLFLVARLQAMTPEKRLLVTAASISAGLALKNSEISDMDPFAVAARVTSFFETEEIEYFLGGSLASTVHGEPRFTQDVDIVVRLKPETTAKMMQEFGTDFYLSESAIREAIARRSSANLIHLESNFKIDLLMSRERAFEKSRFARRVRVSVGRHSFWFCTPEDIILVKLEWYRARGEVLERQLRDVQTVLMVQQSLDLDYLHLWARELKVSDLLESSLRDAGVN